MRKVSKNKSIDRRRQRFKFFFVSLRMFKYNHKKFFHMILVISSKVFFLVLSLCASYKFGIYTYILYLFRTNNIPSKESAPPTNFIV